MVYRKDGRTYKTVPYVGCSGHCSFYGDNEVCWAGGGEIDCTANANRGKHVAYRETLFSKIRNWRKS